MLIRFALTFYGRVSYKKSSRMKRFAGDSAGRDPQYLKVHPSFQAGTRQLPRDTSSVCLEVTQP